MNKIISELKLKIWRIVCDVMMTRKMNGITINRNDIYDKGELFI